MPDWKQLSDEMTRLLRLRSTPAAVRFCRSSEELTAGQPTGLTACQMVRVAAYGHMRVACSPDQLGCDWAQVVYGFRPASQHVVESHGAQFGSGPADGPRLVQAKPRLPVGEYAGVVAGPLDAWDLPDPDVVVFVVDSLQSMALSDAVVHSAGENVSYEAGSGSGVCAFAVVRPMISGRPNWVAPCRGARRLGAFQDHDLLFSVPAHMLSQLCSHALQMERAGVWPIPSRSAFFSQVIPSE